MWTRFEFEKPNNLNQLHDQILADHPDLTTTQLGVQGSGDTIIILLDEEIAPSLIDSIAAIVETHVPIEVAHPNWQQFRSSVLGSPAYIRIATSTPVAQALNSALVAMLFGYEQNPGSLPEIFNLWNAIASSAQPTETEIESLNQIAESCNMPFILDSNGLMIAS